ncbi:Flp pilus assembly protein CpaB [uncultured Desulfosarcina sp.]|uniref:Flp pilus assembly protein CpaB n=1 Tax=uncultured Desulfosarcina sp. TaxID=218289 RepID=UPI0029C8D774|nr:Flp pilus assembly protein CpaB [uncultured Desulfosarcina sp.]
MRKTRGLIALAIALVLGIVAARAVMVTLNRKPQPQAVKQAAKPAAPPERLFETLPAHLRLVNVRVDDVTGVSRELKSGDRVDVIATTPLEGSRGGTVSRILLENVEIGRMSNAAPVTSKLATMSKFWTVSLLVPPEDAVTLVGAAQASTLSLMARSGAESSSAAEAGLRSASFVYTGAHGLRTARRPVRDEIPADMRAVTLSLAETDGICGIIKPGDRVDVVYTCQSARINMGQDRSAGATAKVDKLSYSSQVLLQNVEVLDTDRQYRADPGNSEPTRQVTLLVSPRQATKLAVLTDSGARHASLRLVARNPEDTGTVPVPKVELGDLLSDRMPEWKVDIIQGNQMKVQQF